VEQAFAALPPDPPAGVELPSPLSDSIATTAYVRELI
jgi:hypothetical protein